VVVVLVVVLLSVLESDLVKKFFHAVDSVVRVGLDGSSLVGVVSLDVFELML
jgi:hypothetical protein